MENTHTMQDLATCPLCRYPLNSSWHLAGCEMSKSQQVREVCPPEWTRPESWRDQSQALSGLLSLGSIAHELKTPMVVLLGYADLLRSGRLGPINPRQAQTLADMQDSGERLQRLIVNMLKLCELDRPEGRLKEESEASEVHQQLRMIFDHWKPAAQRKSIQYEFLTTSSSCWVQMSPMDMHHAISNLIENALKFTPEKGKVLVTVKTCFWDYRQDEARLALKGRTTFHPSIENAVQIDVRDTGPGVAPEHYKSVFKDFVQLPGAPTGHGLGLSIARRLVMAQQGRIWVESAPGEGSIFSVLLPTIAEPAQLGR
jgi:signal transduction histidine kinase